MKIISIIFTVSVFASSSFAATIELTPGGKITIEASKTTTVTCTTKDEIKNCGCLHQPETNDTNEHFYISYDKIKLKSYLVKNYTTAADTFLHCKKEVKRYCI
jgi:hypothetical protein